MSAKLGDIFAVSTLLGLGAGQLDFIALHSARTSFGEGDLGFLPGSVLMFDHMFPGDHKLAIVELGRCYRFHAPPAPEHAALQMTVTLLHAQPPGSAARNGQRPLAEEWIVCRQRRARPPK